MSLIRPKGRRYNSRKVAKIYRKYPFPSPRPPPLPRYGEQRKFRAEGGSKRRQFPRGWGSLTEVFFQGV